MKMSCQNWNISKTLLLVHSEPYIRDILDICLTYLGWKVLTANSPLEGLSRAVRHQPDAIVFGLSTAGMNFFAFVRRLRQQASTQGIPMILIGDETHWFNVLLLKELNIIGVLDYPSDINEFQSQILSLFHREEEHSMSVFSKPRSPTARPHDSMKLCAV